MNVSQRIKDGIQHSNLIENYIKSNGLGNRLESYTRTQFNQIANLINKRITEIVIENPDLLESGILIGLPKLDQILLKQGFKSTLDFTKYLSNRFQYRTICWISGKTLQSYWHGEKAKNMKLNVLLLYLGIDMAKWDQWRLDHDILPATKSIPDSTLDFFPITSLKIIRNYYLGNYYLYYQKTDHSENIIKTPFIIRENENGNIIVKSVSEGHRYLGKVLGIRDGCVYINCQNLDFEEMEQYIFNIGLETKPEVLFGVSNTVSVKSRVAVGLKNVLVKQKTEKSNFEEEPEIEIPFKKVYHKDNEESLIVKYLKHSQNNIIISHNCCSLEDLKSDKF